MTIVKIKNLKIVNRGRSMNWHITKAMANLRPCMHKKGGHMNLDEGFAGMLLLLLESSMEYPIVVCTVTLKALLEAPTLASFPCIGEILLAHDENLADNLLSFNTIIWEIKRDAHS
jgi:hypothetical protein